MGNEMGDFLPFVNLGLDFQPIQLTSGKDHTCALANSSSSSVKCWGNNKQFQLGDGTNNSRGDNLWEMGDNLTSVQFGSDFVPIAIEAGSYLTCAIGQNHQVACWGYDIN